MSAARLLATLGRLGVRLWLEGENLRFRGPKGVLSREVLGELRAHKAEVIALLRETAAPSRAGTPAIAPVPREADLPLSFPQQRLWFMDKLGAGSAYNTRLPARLSGPLDVGALEDSLRRIVQRHEVLRTTFDVVDGRPVQRIAREPDLLLERVDLRNLPEADRDEVAQRLVAEEGRRPFDLARGPLLRSTLIRLGGEEHVLLVVFHHIVFDGWSMGVFKRELSEHYRALTSGEKPRLPELQVQYADFAHWQNRWLQGDVLDTLLDYWRGALGEDLPALELPLDRPRPAVPTFRGEVHRFVLPCDLTEALENIGRDHRASLAVTLLASFQALLARWTGQDDIVLGWPIANRNRSEIENLIGFFVNTLVIRADSSDDPKFTEFLRRVRRTALRADDNQDLPFERLVEELAPERHLGHNPLFQVVFAVQNAATDNFELSGLAVSEFELTSVASRFDLEAHLFAEEGHGLRGWFVYNPDLFDASTIERLAGHFRVLLEGIVAEPEARLSQLPVLTTDERHRLLVEWNKSSGGFASDRCIHALFEERATETPDATAVVCEDRRLTYGELNARSNRLAHHLRARSVGPDVLVGIYAERGPELIVGILGILKAGGAYVPLDPAYPAERLAFIVSDSGMSLLLTQDRLVDSLPESPGEILRLDGDWPAIESESSANPEHVTAPRHVAYVIYTSGSTGKPKGVPVEHRNVHRLFTATDAWYGFGPEDVWTMFHSPAFDFSVWEIWGALLYGGRVVVVPYEVSRSPEEFYELVAREGVTVLNQTPSAFRQFIRADESLGSGKDLSLRTVIFGGEALELQSLRPWFERHGDERPLLVNMYGITETTVHVTYRPLRMADVESSAGSVIGRPIPDLSMYILDEHLQPVPIGVAGEMYVGGAGVARGYLNRPALTAERFVSAPFAGAEGKRLYRTGDVARYLADGDIEYLGRNDDQVKIRGFRIELGEIKTALCRHEQIREAVVIVREDQSGERYLVAYGVPVGADVPGAAELREHLLASLPDYMVPSAFLTLDAIPLTPNGKIDRRALPEPGGDRQAAEEYVAPRGGVETQIAAIWRAVLNIDRVGIRDNFFDLGGHSLQLIRVYTKLREELGVDLTMTDLFRFSTVEALAQHLSVGDASGHTIRARDAIRSGIAARDGHKDRAIAVIGVAGRFPGAADVETFWSNLRDGVESIRFFDQDDLRTSGVSEALLQDPSYVPAKGYLDDVDQFDARFFGCTPREAEILDPQQRLFLECAWEALEYAGYDPERLDSRVGVYAGTGSNSYVRNVRSHRNLVGSAGSFAVFTSSEKDFLATRVAYKLDLRGPAVTVQTACSTSLVAVHEACKSLLMGECAVALAGGVSVTVPVKAGYVHQERGILSRDGHCRAFDAEGTGTLGGDGVGIVVLKRLEDALADGDPIQAVIKGSAINNDGSVKVGYTAPSVTGQSEVIATALRMGDVDPETVTYVETHGTATELGDPIEVAALSEVFGERAPRKQYCAIGSLKSNVGHLDAAAGVGGLIKTVLALEHRLIPPSLHYRSPNPQIDFANSPFFVNTELREWEPDGDGPLRAGVSSFGIGGTNAHVVLEEAPAVEPSDPAKAWQLLTLSARTASALERATDDLAAYLKGHEEINLADVAYTLQVGRREFAHRRVVVCEGWSDAVGALETRDRQRAIDGVREPGEVPVVFMFTGQGAQYPNMALGLYRTESGFRSEVDHCCEILRGPLGLDLREMMFPPEGEEESARERLDRTEWTQPALFVIEYALARLWMSWGVQPSAMIGHSIGEYVAACLSGVMSLEDGLGLVAERGRLMGALPDGSMLAVPLAEEDLAPLLGERLSIATLNGPSMCVVSGEDASIAALEAELRERGLEPRALRTSHAFHSPMMDPIVEPFTERVRKVALESPRIPYVSNVTGRWITASEATDPGYWASHLRRAVRFSDGLETLFTDPERVLLEVGPGNTLASLARRHPSRRREQAVVSSLRHPTDDRADEASTLEGVGRLWLAGVRPDWSGVHSGECRHRVVLPAYPFERQRYWIESSGPAVTRDLLRRKPDARDWLYVPSWKPAPLSLLGKVPDDSTWLVFTDGNGLGDRLVAELEDAGASVARVAAGRGFSRESNGRYVLEPGEGEDYLRLLESLAAEGQVPSGVVHLWSVTPDGESSERHLETGFYSLLHLARALAGTGLDDALDLTVVTSEVQEVTGEEDLSPWKATVLGPCKVLGMELPELRCRSIDVTWPATEDGLAALASDLALDVSSGTSDGVVAYRGRRRWVQGFEAVRVELPDSGQVVPPRIRKAGVYLITGGLGGVGLELASYLARQVRARLVLVGRTGLPPAEQWDRWVAEHDEQDTTRRRIGLVRELQAAGAEVMVCGADVTDASSMERAVLEAEARFGALNGVIHAAGVGNARTPIREASREDCERVFGPKLLGLPVLDEVIGDRGLDFFLVHSSLSSAMGAMEGSAYTAAHLFMDVYTRQRSRESRVPWRSVNWETWDTWKVEQGTYAPGLQTFMMAPEEFGDALTRVLSLSGVPQVLVSTGDVQERIDHWSRRRESEAEDDATGDDRSALHPRPVLEADYVDPRTEVERKLADLWETTLGIERVGIHDNFFELGGDSLVELQILAKANQMGLVLTPKDVFTHQTIAELAALSDTQDTQADQPPFESVDRSAEEVTETFASPDYTAVGLSESDLAKIVAQVKKK